MTTRSTSDVLTSVVRALEHYDRMGWLNEIPEGERQDLDMLLAEARELYVPRASALRDVFDQAWARIEDTSVTSS